MFLFSHNRWQELALYSAFFVLSLLVAFVDFRLRRIPNWVSLPVLAAGLLAHFPGRPEAWGSAVLLFAGWQAGWMGGGDAKWWLACIWLAPGEVLAVWGVLVGMALLQIGWRYFRRERLVGVKTAGGWRVVPVAFYLLVKAAAC